jgi:hypothetical protein
MDNIELPQSNSEEYVVPNPKVKPAFCYRGSFGDEPWGIIIINSGWQGMYHVIIEFGDSDDYKHKFMDLYEIEKEYGLKIEDIDMKEFSYKYPNDHDLGKAIRNKIYGSN